MKRNGFKACICLMIVSSVYLLCGCDFLWQNDKAPIKYISLEEEVSLTENTSSPFADFSFHYSYLNEKHDSIAHLINREVQRELLGEDYASLTPEVAVDSFKNTFFRNYRKEVGEIYRQEPEPVMPWFYRSLRLQTSFSEGREGTWNVVADFYQYDGGLHPHIYSRWMNFDRTSGRLLKVSEVFPTASQKKVEERLQQALLELYQAENLDSLKAMGYLTHTPLFIPENFLLEKDSIAFLFNTYDIAHYAAGSTVVKIGYNE